MRNIKNKFSTNQHPFLWGGFGTGFLQRAGLVFFFLFFSLLSGAGWGGISSFAQCGTTPSPSLSFINPSFEGPACAGCQPGPWVNCGGSPDTQPGMWGFTQAPSNGSSYVSFLQDGTSSAGYYEGSSQALSSCMTAGQVYTFSVDLAHSDVYNTASPGDCYSSLEILGSNGLCAESEVLWQSGLIMNTAWQTFTVTLTPTSNWCYVTFRPYWISSCTGYANIMMDNLGAFETNSPVMDATVSADISCSQNIVGTTSCPADSIVLTGLFTGTSINATMLTDTTWQTNVAYPLGSQTAQKITVHAFLSTGVSLYDTITFNLVDITPDFSATSVCVGNVTAFTDNSTTSSGTITAWTWNFGDLSPINTTQSPAHTFTNPGIYNVSLLLTNSSGCMDTITKPVQVYFKPITGFTHTDVCFGDTINFTNNSSVDPSTSIAGSLWTFGDATPTSSLQNPNHYYSGAGTYAVILVSTTADGCSTADTNTVKTFDTPTSVFTFDNGCLLDSTKFSNTSVNPTMGSIASWSWDFGDSSPTNTTVWSPSHQYPSPGNYVVTLITNSSNLGCPDTVQNSITVYSSPVGNFSYTNVCLNQPMNFYDSSIVPGGSIASQSWSFGDGSPLETLQNPSHTFTNAGTFSVTLIVISNDGCSDTITKNVVVHPFPAAQFSSSAVCDGNNVQFNDLSTIPSTDTIQSWTWSFGDASPFSTNQSTSHLYPAAGSYSVQLSVISYFGCPDSITKNIIVNPNPVVSFVATDTAGCEPMCTSFINSSSITPGTNTLWLWNFGDGSPTSNSQSLDHCYINDSIYSPNFFDVTLTVTSDSGCVSTLSKNNYITVYPNPTANFTVQPTTTSITDPIISFANLSTGGNFWNWNFGDMDSSSSFNPLSHAYGDSGTYVITLITTTQYGCADTTYQSVVIESDFLFFIPNAFTPDGDGLNDNFTGKGIFINTYEMSIFDRWGNLIFFTDDLDKPWDGKANHGTAIAQADVYVYVVKVVDFNRRKHNYRGIVTLVR